MATNLPEGTDTVIKGAAADDDGQGADRATSRQAGGEQGAAGAIASLRQQADEKVQGLKGQATDKARDFATQGKDRATGALDSIARLVGDAATQVDEKVGSAYGDYARRASDQVASFSSTLNDKSVDELLEDAKAFIRKSPALAIGAAAVIGFALVRLVRSGADGTDGANRA